MTVRYTATIEEEDLQDFMEAEFDHNCTIKIGDVRITKTKKMFGGKEIESINIELDFEKEM